MKLFFSVKQFFSMKLLSKSRPWAFHYSAVGAGGSKIWLIPPTFSLFKVSARERFWSQFVGEKQQWFPGRSQQSKFNISSSLITVFISTILHFSLPLRFSIVKSLKYLFKKNWNEEIAKSEGRILEEYWKDPELEDSPTDCGLGNLTRGCWTRSN